jgi:hypothetical protein
MKTTFIIGLIATISGVLLESAHWARSWRLRRIDGRSGVVTLS